MPIRYAVIGAGALGTAAAYDLARFGSADEVRVLDLQNRRAQTAVERINRRLRRPVARAGVVNAAEVTSTSQVLEGLDGCLSAVPAALHSTVARAAIRAGVHYSDLGGAASAILDLHEAAKRAEISLVPDSGATPGLSNLLVAYGLHRMDAPHSVRVRAGDLPQSRDLPLGYQPHFAVEALATRYFGRVEQLVDGERVKVPALSGLETTDVPPLGDLEAFATPGGCDTCTATYASRLTHFDFKTLRYPGHHAAVSLLARLGFLSTEPVDVDGHAVRPLRMFQSVMSQLWNQPEAPDVFVLRVEVLGSHLGEPARCLLTVVDRAEGDDGAAGPSSKPGPGNDPRRPPRPPDPGFTATQRCAGVGAGIVLSAQVAGRTPHGARPPERALADADIPAALERRGIALTVES